MSAVGENQQGQKAHRCSAAAKWLDQTKLFLWSPLYPQPSHLSLLSYFSVHTPWNLLEMSADCEVLPQPAHLTHSTHGHQGCVWHTWVTQEAPDTPGPVWWHIQVWKLCAAVHSFSPHDNNSPPDNIQLWTELDSPVWCKDQAAASPGEMQHLVPRPRPPESESAFYQDSQGAQ